jgi:signal transduction histidine kinase
LNINNATKTLGEILIVDDTIESLQLLKQILSDTGYTVRLAQDGAMALHSALKRQPDLMLLDIRMPGIDGYEVCRRIKSNPETSGIPIIFLSALQDKSSLLKGFELGATDYINKPYLAEEVLARVHTHIELQQLRVDLEAKLKARTQNLETEILERKEIEHELRLSQTKLQNLSAHLEDVREKERARLARELHDEMGQALTVMKMDLVRLYEHNELDDKFLKERLSSLLGVLNQVADTARSISENLRPGMLDVFGLNAAVQSYVEKYTLCTGIKCLLTMSHDEFEFDDRLATALFRIVQESLTNVAKHAEAKQVEIKIFKMDNRVVLIIQDDGVGLAPDACSKNCFGMIGMRERVRSFGGEFVLESNSGYGTRIEVYIPLFEKFE